MKPRPNHPSRRPQGGPQSQGGPRPQAGGRPSAGPRPPGGGVGFKRPPLTIQLSTLWDYPSQDYGTGHQGVPGYKGATPSYVIWNLLQRYTIEKELVVDSFAGSGTTLDVARDLNRKALGYDVHPTRTDIFRVDARKLPPELTGKVDFVFIDPPYGTHLDYGDDPRDIGKLDLAAGPAYYDAMDAAFAEIHRILKPDRHMALYVGDSYEHRGGKGTFHPVGFELFARLRKRFEPVDIVAVTRHNKTLEMGNYRAAAEAGNYFLRGFNHLFIMKKA
ncbi:MAG: putative methyltransferase [Phycisphaerales bacterium]|nr:putative methyltransferase [Phycisphaerales bacterium]